MGREIKRVPLDFDFPIDESYHDVVYEKHEPSCPTPNECECDIDFEPPKGDGWQLWQTVSDGPISPVFATPEALIDWMCQPVPVKDRPNYAPYPYPPNPWAQGWKREIAEPFVRRGGSVPSFAISSRGLETGAEFVVRESEKSKSGQ